MPAGSSFASSPPSAFGPVELSTQSLHELAVQAFRVGNRGRLSLCEALRALHETRLYLDLGFPGLAGYADAFFQLRRAETFEYVRVARSDMEKVRRWIEGTCAREVCKCRLLRRRPDERVGRELTHAAIEATPAAEVSEASVLQRPFVISGGGALQASLR